MRSTPRTFVGSVVLSVDGPVSADLVRAVEAEVGALAGISRCQLDPAGTLVVTAAAPVDRTDVLEVLDRLGCRVRT